MCVLQFEPFSLVLLPCHFLVDSTSCTEFRDDFDASERLYVVPELLTLFILYFCFT